MAMAPQPPKVCILMPAFCEAALIGPVVVECREYVPDVVVIDDGSTDDTAAVAAAAGATVLSQVQNGGKGAALQHGFQYAEENGYDIAITMDADGQHAPSDIPAFLQAYARTGTRVLIGNRMGDNHTMPWLRRQTNRVMSSWLSRLMGRYVPDTQCGYRLYHRSAFSLFATLSRESRRYAAESEILLRLALGGISMAPVTIQTIYGAEQSKVNPCTDTLRFFRMLLRFRRIKTQHNRGNDL